MTVTSPPSTRAEKERMARRLRSEGLMIWEIAERMGVAKSTAGAYLTDPGLSKQKARRYRYAGVCAGCGRPTDGSRGPGQAGEWCIECIRWTDDEILAAIRRWVEEHAIPPTVIDWRFARDGHPSAQTVVQRLGWNEALLAAGFSLVCDRRPETWEQILRHLQAGGSVADIAAELGCTPANIHQRARYRGTSVNAIRAAAGIYVHQVAPWDWIVEQLRAGRPPADIAAEIDVAPQTIANRASFRGTSITQIREAAQ